MCEFFNVAANKRYRTDVLHIYVNKLRTDDCACIRLLRTTLQYCPQLYCLHWGYADNCVYVRRPTTFYYERFFTFFPGLCARVCGRKVNEDAATLSSGRREREQQQQQQLELGEEPTRPEIHSSFSAGRTQAS